MSEQELVLGIDLGGTHIRLGLVSPSGKCSRFHREVVDKRISGDDFVGLIARRTKALGMLSKISAVGIGLAGVVFRDGTIKPELVNLPGLGGYPLVANLSEILSKPCLLGNDADLALRGETHFGAARGYQNVLMLTLGTGIGGGLLLDGRLRQGPHASTVEIGRMIFGYPNEEIISPIEDLYAPGNLMKRLGDETGLLFDRIQQGDDYARQLASEMFQALAILITNVHLLLDLELVLIGGGLASAGNDLVTGLCNAVQRVCPPENHGDLNIELGALPADTAGVIGAACMWFERYGLLPHLQISGAL
jgi:glucokinase